MVAAEPDIVVLDDPSTGGVSEETRARLRRWFEEDLLARRSVQSPTSELQQDDTTGEAGDGRQA